MLTSFFRRSNSLSRLLVSGLAVAFASAACGVRPCPAGAALVGAKTSDEAARRRVPAETDTAPVSLAGWLPASNFAASAAADTTEVELPDDVEKKWTDHLYRDIAIFVVVSAFVGYFIVKVFLEGDTDEPPPSGGGKDIPGPL